jgi:3-deoxy-manno-octulosonate cytidylyltransferase (CMP-KDO synthetase)
MDNEVIGIIPARYNSSRFPGKPLVSILGKTLLQRTYENASLASLKEVVVATDDQRIFDHVVSFGGQVMMTGSDCLTGTDRLAEVLRMRPEWLKASAIVNIQGDEPFIEPWAIDLAVNALLDDPAAKMSTLAAPLLSEKEALNPSNVKCVVDFQGNALYFSRALIPSNKRNQFKSTAAYLGHIGLYVYRPEFILEYQRLEPTPLQLEEDLEQLKVLEHGYRIKVMVIDHASIGVDTPEDIKKVEQRLNR